MASIPPEVAALLGAGPIERSGRGAGRVLSGNGRVVPELAAAPPWLAEHMVSAKDEAARRLLG